MPRQKAPPFRIDKEIGRVIGWPRTRADWDAIRAWKIESDEELLRGFRGMGVSSHSALLSGQTHQVSLTPLPQQPEAQPDRSEDSK